MNSLQPWPVLLATGVTLGLAAPIARAAGAAGVGALAFALWPTLVAALLLALLGLWRHGLPRDRLRLAVFSSVAGLFGHALPMTALAVGGERGAGAYMMPAWQALAQQVEGGAMTGAGHWIADEQPAALVARLETFFDRVEAGSAAGTGGVTR